MKIFILQFILFFAFCVVKVNGQSKTRRNLYLYFPAYTLPGKYFKTCEKYTKNNKETKYDVYVYGPMNGPTGKKIRYAFIVKDPVKFTFRDSVFAKCQTRTIDQVNKDKKFIYDQFDDRFPYKHVYIVEEILPNKFKVTEVAQYLGSQFDL